jgi:hypothetical protein
LGFKTSDVIISTIFAFLSAALASFLFRLDWPWILFLALILDLLFLYLLQNQAKNERKLSKHPNVFPNPMGGGILGQYMLRPWQNELARMGQPKGESWNRELKKLDRMSRKRTRRMRHLQRVRSY